MKIWYQVLSLYLCLTFITEVIADSEVDWDDVKVHCQQTENKQSLECDYRSISATPVNTISAYSDTEDLAIVLGGAYPSKNDITAIFFLIDIGANTPQRVISQSVLHLNRLLKVTQDHHRFAMASFDKKLQLYSAFGNDKIVLMEATKQLQASPKTTELYRNVLQVVRLFEDVEANRKIVIVFSDGLVEDKTYFHSDVIKKARTQNVIINTIAYMHVDSETIGLQKLQKLSEDTGGIFIKADESFELTSNFLLNPYRNVDNGGKFSIDLSPIVNNAISSIQNVSILFQQNTSQTTMVFPISTVTPFKIKNTSIVRPKIILQNDTFLQRRKEIAVPENTWLWYIVVTIIFFLLLFTISTIFMFLRNNKERSSPSFNINNICSDKAYAYLIKNSNGGVCYPITKNIWRIGRARDNELVIPDISISRYHAEIHRDKVGKFILVDINSKNGVYLNYQRVGKLYLSEGDVIKISNINFYFTLKGSDYLHQPITLMRNI